jgi:hypothetical protein
MLDNDAMNGDLIKQRMAIVCCSVKVEDKTEKLSQVNVNNKCKIIFFKKQDKQLNYKLPAKV